MNREKVLEYLEGNLFFFIQEPEREIWNDGYKEKDIQELKDIKQYLEENLK